MSDWEYKPVREVVASKETWKPEKDGRKQIHYLEISGIDNASCQVISTRIIDVSNPPSRAKRIIRTGDIIFGTTRPSLKNIAVIPSYLNEQVCSTGFCVLRPQPDKIITEWLFYLCRSNILVDQVITGEEKHAYPAISDDAVLDSIIPVPPLDEQRRIVARIEELTRRAEEARKLRQEAIAKAQTSLASAIDRIFNNRNEDWTEATVNQLCGKPQYGFTASATSEQVGPRFLRITDIQNGSVDWESVPFCSCDEPQKYRLSDRDIVFARTGATTGKSYLVHNPPESVFASYLIRIRPSERVLPEYIWWYFQSSSYWASVFGGIDDGNRPNMNGSKLGKLKIPFPKSREAQKEIVSLINTLAEKANKLYQLQVETEVDVTTFQSALLAKAFRGEL